MVENIGFVVYSDVIISRTHLRHYITFSEGTEILTLHKGNAKLDVYTFSLPAGHSCPSADDCLSKSHKVTGKITDGGNTLYRCFAASNEASFPSARNSRWSNFDQLRKMSKWEMVQSISSAIPDKALVVRIHVSGDFFNQDYFDAWMMVARTMPTKLFYAYTKSLPYWVHYISAGYKIPTNVNLTASYGGKQDNFIEQFGLKSATVVFHPEEAAMLGLEIDHDDSLAKYGTKSFALLLHGTQPAKSDASLALSRMRKEGIKFSYPKKGKK